MPDPLYDYLLEFQTILVASATGQSADGNRYQQLRNALVSDDRIRLRLPAFVRACRDLGAFWSFIQPRFRSYAERRSYIRSELQSLLEELEHNLTAADREVTDILRRVTTDSIREVWERAQARRSADPDGAITLARTLLESTCKHVLHSKGVEHSEGDELPRLYRLTAEALNIAPTDSTEDAFRRIFGGCASIVESLGTIRNRIGDAHGRGVHAVRPAPRHARLAVNLAGAMATFLIETLQAESDEPL